MKKDTKPRPKEELNTFKYKKWLNKKALSKRRNFVTVIAVDPEKAIEATHWSYPEKSKVLENKLFIYSKIFGNKDQVVLQCWDTGEVYRVYKRDFYFQQGKKLLRENKSKRVFVECRKNSEDKSFHENKVIQISENDLYVRIQYHLPFIDGIQKALLKKSDYKFRSY